MVRRSGAARALGFVLFLGVVRWQQPVPYPSLADAAWLLMYVPMLLGLVGMARLRTSRLSTTLLLDAAVGALAAAAVAVALLYPTILALAAPGTPPSVVVVNLAYPVLDADHRAAAIVESTVNLAHSLGMAVVAEGVETVVVRDRLAAFGCELAQGFLFSPGVPADQVTIGVLDLARPGT